MAASWPEPNPGEIVACFFPRDEAPGKPGPYPRPALVIRSVRDADGTRWAMVSYGTGQRTPDKLGAVSAGELLADPAVHPMLNLREQTKFKLSRSVPLPYNKEWFPAASANGNSPRIGSLPEPLKKEMVEWVNKNFSMSEWLVPTKPEKQKMVIVERVKSRKSRGTSAEDAG